MRLLSLVPVQFRFCRAASVMRYAACRVPRAAFARCHAGLLKASVLECTMSVSLGSEPRQHLEFLVRLIALDNVAAWHATAETLPDCSSVPTSAARGAARRRLGSPHR